MTFITDTTVVTTKVPFCSNYAGVSTPWIAMCLGPLLLGVSAILLYLPNVSMVKAMLAGNR